MTLIEDPSRAETRSYAYTHNMNSLSLGGNLAVSADVSQREEGPHRPVKKEEGTGEEGEQQHAQPEHRVVSGVPSKRQVLQDLLPGLDAGSRLRPIARKGLSSEFVDAKGLSSYRR